MLKDIIAVNPLEDHQLYLRFEDGKEGVIDLKKIIRFTEIFEPLNDPTYFKTVKLNPEWGTIYWENGADLDPDVLYSLVTGEPVPQPPSRIA
jgi:hypothetical protein